MCPVAADIRLPDLKRRYWSEFVCVWVFLELSALKNANRLMELAPPFLIVAILSVVVALCIITHRSCGGIRA